MNMEVRTRYAPSPTGFMHVGNLRTALYEYLIAKSQGGKFILRIEDTDQERLVDGAVEVIYRTLDMVGLKHDEGPDVGGEYGPYVQSQRKDMYKPYAEQLVKEGKGCLVGPTFGAKSKFELKNKSFDTPRVLNEAGLNICIITDAPVIPLKYLPLCAGLAINAGLDEQEAWKAVTINPAVITGIADRVGSLEVGKDADVVITDVWTSMGQEEERQKREAAFAGYCVDEQLMAQAKPDAMVQHCLPAHRGEEITEEVFEANAQYIFEEAENRLHAQKAILVWFMRTDPKEEALKAYHLGKVEALLHSVERDVPSAIYHEDHSER